MGKQRHIIVDRAIQREIGCARFGRYPVERHIQRSAYGLGQGVAVIDRNEPSEPAAFQHFERAAGAIGRNDIGTAGKCFDQYGRQAFPTRRQYEGIGSAHHCEWVAAESRQIDMIVQVQGFELRLQLRTQRSFAQNDQPDGAFIQHLAHSTDQDIEALLVMQSPATQQNGYARPVGQPAMFRRFARKRHQPVSDDRIVDDLMIVRVTARKGQDSRFDALRDAYDPRNARIDES